ncbi:hypothetical protein W97_06219 [Coniosporium apollinis CBS 100218]|uniref:Protein farnesyltransferase subunit beta n=1 Tax=Coniosporium apollinis (strain CBS 100218) TaxID=1168221 RepID=R7YY34_CONA1|nr:uncharacterized protein W97_06219 [Coniosporium apollinis CBS 100218]EON66817.1 hypothetical protein W97_06219 [Coniosporium apollinis CBS 100218]
MIGPRVEELSDSDAKVDDDFESMSDDELPPELTRTAWASVPELFSCPPPIRDELETQTSKLQDKTIQECLPFLTGKGLKDWQPQLNSHGIPELSRAAHVEFLQDALGDYPPQFAVMDASRMWILYWALAGLSFLGEDIAERVESMIYTFDAAQHPSGGFGGGHGQLPHLAPSYTAVLCAALGATPDSYDFIDRKAMWHWLGRMKQPGGGFSMCADGEVDTRGAFCALVIISLLNLPLELPADSPAKEAGVETFVDGLAKWIASCQSYEGGIGGAPGNEAHGAYTFCALGALCILGPPHETIPRYLNVAALVAWLSSRQYAPEGGLAGRTNKLVDGCYSHWIGGCWALVEAAVAGPGKPGAGPPPSLWSREGLIRYILCCAQGHYGLRDKPSKHPDAYHTCYNLAGFSSAQHVYSYDDAQTEGDEEEEFQGPLSAGFHWRTRDVEVGEVEGKVFDEGDRVAAMNPVYLIPWGCAEKMRRYFEGKVGF